MSNSIQVRRGTEAERVRTVFSNGEPVWTTDTNKLYIGDGVTQGGVPVFENNMAYIRNAFSERFNEQVNVLSVVEALDVIFKFTNNVATNIFYGDVATNAAIMDVDEFFAQLLTTQWVSGYKDITYRSSYSYRVFAYPKSYGALIDIQDPNFSYSSIRNSYEASPREATYQGMEFYIYFALDPCLSPDGKIIRYVV